MTTQAPVIALLISPDDPPPGNLAEIEELATVRLCTADDLGAALPGADVLVLWDFFSRGLAEHWGEATASLRWVHVCAAGVDSLLFDELRSSDVVVTNAHGVFDRPIAEFVLAAILAHHKGLHESMALQRDHEWRHRETVATHRTSALVIGTGGIGRATAKLLRAVGIRVVGAGRTARASDPDFGHVVATDDLAAHMGGFDTVVAIAPLTEQTAGMIDAAVLAAMKPGAHLVNVGRGELVDEAALVASLRSGHLGAATLDVFVTEPLPADSELWDLPGVAISAHMSGDAVGWREALAEQVLDNLRRYVAAGTEEPADVLVNVVDKERGYIRVGG